MPSDDIKLYNCFCEMCEKLKIGNGIRTINLRSSKQRNRKKSNYIMIL